MWSWSRLAPYFWSVWSLMSDDSQSIKSWSTCYTPGSPHSAYRMEQSFSYSLTKLRTSAVRIISRTITMVGIFAMPPRWDLSGPDPIEYPEENISSISYRDGGNYFLDHKFSVRHTSDSPWNTWSLFLSKLSWIDLPIQLSLSRFSILMNDVEADHAIYFYFPPSLGRSGIVSLPCIWGAAPEGRLAKTRRRNWLINVFWTCRWGQWGSWLFVWAPSDGISNTCNEGTKNGRAVLGKHYYKEMTILVLTVSISDTRYGE